MNYTHNIISEALDPDFFTAAGYPLDHKNKPVRDFALLEGLAPSVIEPEADIELKNEEGGWRFKTVPDAGKSGHPRLSYKMMGYIGAMQGVTPALSATLKTKTQKTIMFDPFFQKALN